MLEGSLFLDTKNAFVLFGCNITNESSAQFAIVIKSSLSNLTDSSFSITTNNDVSSANNRIFVLIFLQYH